MATRRASRRGRVRTGRRALFVVLTVFVLVGAAVAAYVAASRTGIFALERINVDGAPAPVAERVKNALQPYLGKSLVGFDTREAERRLATVPELANASFDRAFPHTLKVHVSLERPVAVLRSGTDAWVVSARGRVLRRLSDQRYPPLPRIWVPRSVDVAVNATIGGEAAKAIAALAPLGPLHVGVDVRQVRSNDQELTLVLASGGELRLGDRGDLRLKLAIARQLLPLTTGARYVDVSVPERPVAGYNSQVEG